MKDFLLLVALIALGVSVLTGCTTPSEKLLYRIPQYIDKE